MTMEQDNPQVAELVPKPASAKAIAKEVKVGLRSAGGGQFLIPTGPSVGTTVASGSANAYGSWVEMSSAVGADIFVLGARVRSPNQEAYLQLDVGIGASGAESSIGELTFDGQVGASDGGNNTVLFSFPVPVSNGTRLAARTADNGATTSISVMLTCINQSDVVKF